MSTSKPLEDLLSKEQAELVPDPQRASATYSRLERSLAAGVVAPVDVPPLDLGLPASPLVGLESVEPLAQSAAGTSGSGAAASGGAALSGAGVSVLGSSVAKGIGAGLILLGGGAWWAAEQSTVSVPPPEPNSVAAVATPAPTEPETENRPAEETPEEPESAVLGEHPTDGKAEPRPTPRAAQHKRRTAPSEDTFERELEQIEQAHGALSRGKNEQALDIIEQKEKRKRTGQFSEDREAVRALALCRSNAPNAKRVARRFLSRYPNSVYVEGVRTTCLAASGDETGSAKSR